MNAASTPTPERRPSLAPYLVRPPTPELLRLSEDAFRAARELEQAGRRKTREQRHAREAMEATR